MLYLIVVFLTVATVAAGNLLAFPPVDAAGAWLTVLRPVAAAAAAFAIDGVSAFLIRRLPEPWFSPLGRAFAVPERERRLWRKLGVLRWKDRVPELGGFTSFHKDRFDSASDSAYLGRFLLESNYGVVIHLANALLGFALLPIPFVGGLSVGLPVAAVNLLLGVLPVIILRYHTAPLRRLYARALKKEAEQAPAVPAAAQVGADFSGK